MIDASGRSCSGGGKPRGPATSALRARKRHGAGRIWNSITTKTGQGQAANLQIH